MLIKAFLFFASINFNIVKRVYLTEVPKQCEICQKAINGETPDPVHCQKCQKVIEAESKSSEAESQEAGAVIQQIAQQQPGQSQQGSVIALQDQMGRKVVVVGNTMTMTNQKIQALPQVLHTITIKQGKGYLNCLELLHFN